MSSIGSGSIDGLDTWYFPAWNGDFRLKAKDGKTSSLEIVEPSADEARILNDFLELARTMKWTRVRKKVKTGAIVSAGDKYRQITLRASVAAAGNALVGLLKPGDASLTAIKYESDDEDAGIVEVVESADTKALMAHLNPAPKKKAATKKKPKKAASVTRPTPCCPQCIPGSVPRASEVLLDFLSSEQHEQWAEHRAIEVKGQLTGHTYLVAHRHSPIAQHMKYICADLDDGGVLHFHDWSVPPEEEVLAAKLILEHREPWLRNEATCFGRVGQLAALPTAYERLPEIGQVYIPQHFGVWRHIFKNPFGDMLDGTKDAAFTSSVGAGLFGLVGRDMQGVPL